MKKYVSLGKSKDSLRASVSVQSQSDSPGKYIDSLPCTVSLRVSSSVTVAFVVDWLVLY